MAAAKGTKPPNAGKGRKKGVQNKITRSVKSLLEAAFMDAQADKDSRSNLKVFREENPKEFIAAVSKLLPTELKGELTHNHTAPTLEMVAAALGVKSGK